MHFAAAGSIDVAPDALLLTPPLYKHMIVHQQTMGVEDTPQALFQVGLQYRARTDLMQVTAVAKLLDCLLQCLDAHSALLLGPLDVQL